MKLSELSLLKYDQAYLIKFLMHHNLISKGPNCCNQIMRLTPRSDRSDKFAFRCSVCRRRQSIRIGSFFESSNLTLFQIFMIIIMCADDQNTTKFIKNELDIISNSTVTDWKNFLRDVYINYINDRNEQIGGEGTVVQIDECLICRRKYGVGRILINRDVWVVGGIDDTGRVFMEITERRNRQVLSDIIRRNVAPGSIVVTDGWGGYRDVQDDYLHQVVIHEHQFVNGEGYHTNRIEGTWSACKRLFRKVTNKKKS